MIEENSVNDNALKEVWRLLMKGMAVLMLCGIFVGGCAYFNARMGLENDHAIEQIGEKLLESYLDLPDNSIDFTPED